MKVCTIAIEHKTIAKAKKDLAALYSYYHNPIVNSNEISIKKGEQFIVDCVDKKKKQICLCGKLSPYPLDSFILYKVQYIQTMEECSSVAPCSCYHEKGMNS
jgi:hypothetical protein